MAIRGQSDGTDNKEWPRSGGLQSAVFSSTVLFSGTKTSVLLRRAIGSASEGALQPARLPLQKNTAAAFNYGRPSPTCDLVKATSVAVREPSVFTSSRKLEPLTT